MRCWDAIVAGAGPAGSIAARALARAGDEVLLVDRKAFPRWKVCGSCLSPGALATLDAVGLGDLVPAAGGVPLRRMRLFAGSRQAVLPLLGSWVLAREVLDHALVGAAVQAGVTLLEGTRAEIGGATDASRSVLLIGERGTDVVDARVVVDATGLGGAPADAEVTVDARSRIGVGAVVADSPYALEPGELHMVIGEAGYVGVVRLEDGTLDIGAALDVALLQRNGPAEAVAELLHRAGRPPLEGRITRGWRGTPRLTRRHQRPAAERLLRVGDAAAYVEPFTGEGIGWALEGGLSVAALATQGARAWHPRLERAWTSRQRESAAARRLCAALAWGLRRPRLARGAVRALSHAPILAGPFVRRAARRPSPVLVT